MLSNAFAAPLRLELKPSYQRRYWRWFTHLVVLATLPLLQSVWLMAGIAALILLSLYRTRTESKLVLLWHADGHWTLFEDGTASPASLTGTAFVQSWLVILPLSVGSSAALRYIPVFPDMLSAETFRRLRVGLRTGRGDKTAADDLLS